MAQFDLNDYPEGYRENLKNAIGRFPESKIRAWMRYVNAGDPVAEAMIISLRERLPEAMVFATISKAVDEGIDAIEDAPEAMKRFFEEIDNVPYWVDWDIMKKGSELFSLYAPLFTASFVAEVLPKGFATFINKSFVATGRVLESAINRLKSNNRHLVESFLLHGLSRYGDGLRYSVRIRLIHAQLRMTLQRNWDHRYGVPNAAALLAHGYAIFSAGLFETATRLGMEATKEQQRGFLMIWKYVGYLMGIPSEFLTDNYEDGLALVELGDTLGKCVDEDCSKLTNALIQNAATVAGITDPEEHAKVTSLIYAVSHQLRGDEFARAMNYPQHQNISLATIRLKEHAHRLRDRLIPGAEQKRRLENFELMLDVSLFTSRPISFSAPKKETGYKMTT